MMRIMRYWAKKHHRATSEKVVRVNKRKKKAAETKLRIKGKFVTFEQAVALVGKRQVNKLVKKHMETKVKKKHKR